MVSPPENSVRVYAAWHRAGMPVELHVFVKGAHGFGIRKQNLPSDAWPELFHTWLEAQGLVSAPAGQ